MGVLKTSPKDLDDQLRRGEEYVLSEVQQKEDSTYERIVELLRKAGFPAVYHKYWTRFPEEQPGYISLERKEDDTKGL